MLNPNTTVTDASGFKQATLPIGQAIIILAIIAAIISLKGW